MAESASERGTRTVPGNTLRDFLPAALYCLGLFALFNETLMTMVGIWESSATYKHGYIIVPISLWLLWEQRAHLRTLPIVSCLPPLLLTFAVGPAWLLANLIDVNVVKQFAFVALLIIGLWTLLGQRFARAIAFPLGFLFFMVPVGDVLVPFMMEFTASSTVTLVKMTGIPVYREGMYFTLPSGSWSVVYACSGMRYLIAAFTLGVLYAYLTYRSLRRRLIFSAVSLLVPILANSARAYIIVMLGHLSGMKIATGVDHLLYGWVFFGIVMFVLFWLGAIWREDLDDEPQQAASADTGTDGTGASRTGAWTGLCMALLAIAVWPALSLAMSSLEPRTVVDEMTAPEPVEHWMHAKDPQWQWRPVSRGPDREMIAFYHTGEVTVAVIVAQYLRQEEGEELVSGLDLTPDDAVWRITARGKSRLGLHGDSTGVERKELDVPGAKLLALSWYRIGEDYTAHPYIAKALELRERLMFSDSGSASITVVTDVPVNAGGEKVLQEFVDTYLEDIESMLGSGLLDGSQE